MFIRQPRSPASTSVGAGRLDRRAALSSTILVEISGYLTQNVPPKPQQTSASGSSASSRPRNAREQPARLALDAELAQARAGIVIGGARRQLGRDRLDAADVDQEGGQLEGARRELARPLAHRPSRASNSSG